MATETQIVREAPEIEAYKLGLLKDAKALADVGVTLPTQQVAGFTALQDAAFAGAGQAGGIGGYQPYLTQAGYTMGDAEQQLQGVYGAASPYLTGAMQTADPYRQASEAALLQSMQGVPTQVTAGQQGIQGALDYGQTATGGALSAMDAASLAARGQAGIGQTGIRAAQPLTQTSGQFGQQAAQQGIAGLAGGAAQFDPSTIAQYMSPYENAAVQQAMQDIARQGQIAQQGQAAQAVGAGAFGGSRAGVQAAETARAQLEQQGRTAAQMRAQGYQSAAGQAQQAFEQARARQLQSAGLQGQLGQTGASIGLQSAQQQAALAQQAAQMGISTEQLAAQIAQQGGQLGQAQAQLGVSGAQAGGQLGLQGQQAQAAMAGQMGDLGLQYGQFGLQTGQALGQLGLQSGEALGTMGLRQASLGELAQNTGLKNIQTQYELGKQQQAQQQATLEAKRQSDLAQLYEPYQRLSYLSDIYKGAPSTQQTIATSTSPSVSPAQQFMGLGIAGLSAAAGANKAGLFG
jgi:hypothetical protein